MEPVGFDQWICTACTFSNSNPCFLCCEMCGTARGSAGATRANPAAADLGGQKAQVAAAEKPVHIDGAPAEIGSRRKRPRSGCDAPQPNAYWKQTLSKQHTDPQPLPGQRLEIKWKGAPGETEIRTCRTTQFVPFEFPESAWTGHKDVFEVGPSGSQVVILRDVDGLKGRAMAESLEGAYGIDVLSGRGSDNKCSSALYHAARAANDRGNGDTCVWFKDGFRKLWPLMGSGHGGNFDGDKGRPVVRAFFESALDAAGLPPASTNTTGGTQILRFRTTSCKQKPCKKRNASGEAKGDTLHMHVDQDSKVDRVMLISIGCPVLLAIDDGRSCERIAQCEMNMVTPHNKDQWKQPCKTCQIVQVNSGDVVIFDGNPTASVAHGIIDTLDDPSTTEGLPPWAHGCRVSVQYRLFASQQ